MTKAALSRLHKSELANEERRRPGETLRTSPGPPSPCPALPCPAPNLPYYSLHLPLLLLGSTVRALDLHRLFEHWGLSSHTQELHGLCSVSLAKGWIVCVFVCWLCYEGERPRSGLSNGFFQMGQSLAANRSHAHIGNVTGNSFFFVECISMHGQSFDSASYLKDVNSHSKSLYIKYIIKCMNMEH